MASRQFKAGFLLEPVLRMFPKPRKGVSKEHGLLNLLSTFQAKGDLVPKKSPQGKDPVLAVLSNLLSRGLPTLPGLIVEEVFSKAFPQIERDPAEWLYSYRWKDGTEPTAALKDQFLEAFHLVDPRRRGCEAEGYNVSQLGSPFEEQFLFELLPENWRCLSQVLQPQRPMNTIARGYRGVSEQRVDFALEFPYIILKETDEGEREWMSPGWVVELDGDSFHRGVQKYLDERRDLSVRRVKWLPFRIGSKHMASDLPDFMEKVEASGFLKAIQTNYARELNGEWLDTLQLALSPFGVARIQKTLLELFLAGHFLQKETIRLAVIERDVPCGRLAVRDLWESWRRLLDRVEQPVDLAEPPNIELDIWSTPEFASCRLHGNEMPQVYDPESFPVDQYDLVLDIALLERAGLYPGRTESQVVTIRSAHFDDLDDPVVFHSASPLEYKPAVIWEDEVPRELADAKSELEFFLRWLFRKKEFRPGQLPILDRAMRRKTVIGLLPTGGGKSLTYQIAALLQPGFCLVVDPIKSLMLDQYEGLLDAGIDAALFINSSLSTSERRLATNQFKAGSSLFTFVSPERLQIEEFRETMKVMNAEGHFFSYCVIDEAHCVSEWGHDFRTAYLRLGHNAMNFCKTFDGTPLPLFGLTATASFDVLADVERELAIPGQPLEPEAVVRFENTVREELQYRILPIQVDFEWKEIVWKGERFRVFRTTEKELDIAVAEAKQEVIIQWVRQLGREIQQLNKKEVLCEILSQAYQEFTPDHIQAKVDETAFMEEGLNRIFLPAELARESFFHDDHKNALLVFCPHRTYLRGVTDRYKERWDWSNKRWVSENKRGAIADRLEDALNGKVKIGWFMGTPDSGNPKTLKRIAEEVIEFQQQFVKNQLDIMVATKAFGMGIDKPNIRSTVHNNYPNSLESFVQESGRAGRDRRLAICPILFADVEGQTLRVPSNGATMPDELELLLKNLRGVFMAPEDMTRLQSVIAYEYPDWVQPLFGPQDERVVIVNPDKRVLDYFHDNAFRGEDREEAMCFELLSQVYYPAVSPLYKIQQRAAEEFGVDGLKLNPWPKKHPRRIYLNANEGTVGYVMLNNLAFVSGDILIPGLEEYIEQALAAIQSDFGTNWVTEILLERATFSEEGLLPKLDRMKPGERGTFYIPFSSGLKKKEPFARALQDLVVELKGSWPEDTDPMAWWRGDKDQRSLEEWLTSLQEKVLPPELSEWNRKRVERLYFGDRQFSDTSKAIYRLSALGLIDDYTVDYNGEMYLAQFSKKEEADYRKILRLFLLRYYSERRVEGTVALAEGRPEGRQELRYLRELIEFVYKQIAKKRQIGIDDMAQFCRDGLAQPDVYQQNLHLKEYIYFYFNSKYARETYNLITEEGEEKPYSLLKDTDLGREGDWDTVIKYIDAVDLDKSGTPVDNIKHLRGATQRLLRANPQNPALLVLKAYTYYHLFAQTNREDLLREGGQALRDGFRQFQELFPEEPSQAWLDRVSEFRKKIAEHTGKEPILEAIDTEYAFLLMHQENDWITSQLKRMQNDRT